MAIKNNEAKDLVEADTIVEQVEKLPKEERQVVLQQLEIYQGDLPHPDILKGFLLFSCSCFCYVFLNFWGEFGAAIFIS